MAHEDLYVDLFSNSSLDLYPNNRVSSFTVKLDRAVEVNGPFECALAQMITPSMTEVNLKNAQIVISTFPETLLQKTKGKLQEKTVPYNSAEHKRMFIERPKAMVLPTYEPKASVSNKKYSFVHTIPEKENFGVGSDVVKYINQLFHGEEKSDNEAFNEVIKSRMYTENQPRSYESRFLATLKSEDNGTLRIVHRDSDVEIAISGNIARVLGFTVTEDTWIIFQAQGLYQLKTPIDLNASRPSLISVYTNIILPHRVGDTSAPLIRACTIPQKQHNTFLNFEFDSMHYLPVALKYIQEIQVEVRGNDGELIPFEAGILYLRLHFRPRRQR
jgi:hypothetical protein